VATDRADADRAGTRVASPEVEAAVLVDAVDDVFPLPVPPAVLGVPVWQVRSFTPVVSRGSLELGLTPECWSFTHASVFPPDLTVPEPVALPFGSEAGPIETIGGSLADAALVATTITATHPTRTTIQTVRRLGAIVAIPTSFVAGTLVRSEDQTRRRFRALIQREINRSSLKITLRRERTYQDRIDPNEIRQTRSESGDAAKPRLGEHLREVFARYGIPDQVALGDITADRGEVVPLRFRLDTLNHHRRVESGGEFHGRANDCLVRGITRPTRAERPIELDLPSPQVAKLGE